MSLFSLFYLFVDLPFHFCKFIFYLFGEFFCFFILVNFAGLELFSHIGSDICNCRVDAGCPLFILMIESFNKSIQILLSMFPYLLNVIRYFFVYLLHILFDLFFELLHYFANLFG